MTIVDVESNDMLKKIVPFSQCLILGANETGRYIYKRLQKERPDVVVSGWTDKKYAYFFRCKLPVMEPQAIYGIVADTVIIAGRESVAYAEWLIDEYGLDKPGCACYYIPAVEEEFEDFVYPNITYLDEIVTDAELEHIAPVSLLTDKNLDIVIRYLACKEILAGVYGEGMEMYRILTMSMNQGEEYTRPFTRCAYFSAYETKKGFGEFQTSFEKLALSMCEKGFDKRHFIPLTEKREVINGAHRMATALALCKKVYVKVYQGFGDRFLSFSTDDLRERGYTEKQITYIWDSYQDLKGKTHMED